MQEFKDIGSRFILLVKQPHKRKNYRQLYLFTIVLARYYVACFSTHIVLLCMFILTYEWKKLYNFFILHKAEILNYNKLRVRKKWILISLKAVKGLLIAFLLYTFFLKPLINQSAEKVPLEEAYSTETFVFEQ